MSEIKDGGPAFPMQSEPAIHRHGADAIEGLQDAEARDVGYIAAVKRAGSGMTLRDWFAGEALPAVYSDYCEGARKAGFDEGWKMFVAMDAYEMADAMIAAREQQS